MSLVSKVVKAKNEEITELKSVITDLETQLEA